MTGYLLRGRRETICSLLFTGYGGLLNLQLMKRVNYYETFPSNQKLIKSACGHTPDELLLLCFVYLVNSKSEIKKKRGKSLQCEPPQF